MSSDLFVSYLRSAQAVSEDVLAFQRAAIARHLGRRGRLAAEIIGDTACAVEPDLSEAMSLCHRHGATLLMAELGIWGDASAFLRKLGYELRRLNLRFVALDRPEASELTLGIMAAVTEAEERFDVIRTPEIVARRRDFYARFTAERRKCAATGPSHMSVRGSETRFQIGDQRSGTPRSWERARDVAPLLTEIRAAGVETLEQVAHTLNALGIPSARGNRWYPMQVARVTKRLAAVG